MPTDQLGGQKILQGGQGTAVRDHSRGGGSGCPCWCHGPQVAHPKSGSAHRCQSAGRQPPACAAGLGQCQRRPGRPGERWALQVSQSRPRREGRRCSESRHIKIQLLRSHIGKREKEGEQQDSRSGHKGSGTLQGCTWVQRWVGRGRKGAKTVLSLLISLLPFASLLLTYSVPPRHKFTASSQHPCLVLFKPSKTQINSFLLSLHQALTPCPHRAGQASKAPALPPKHFQ